MSDKRVPGLDSLSESGIVSKEWIDACPEAFQYFYDKIGPELKGKTFYPTTSNIFRAFNECPPDDLKVVILGQDPYFDGSATGLAFDNSNDGKRISPSLRKILKEMDEDVPLVSQPLEGILVADSYLGHLPEQGVLLLNTALTVKHGEAGSHIELWKPFTDKIIEYLNTKDNIAWILWGNYAKAFKEKITNEIHHIIEGCHPAARGVHNTFAGGKYFSKCNEYLRQLSLSQISW